MDKIEDEEQEEWSASSDSLSEASVDFEIINTILPNITPQEIIEASKEEDELNKSSPSKYNL